MLIGFDSIAIVVQHRTQNFVQQLFLCIVMGLPCVLSLLPGHCRLTEALIVTRPVP